MLLFPNTHQNNIHKIQNTLLAKSHAHTHAHTAAGPSSNNTSGALLRNPSGHTLQTLQQYHINTHTITYQLKSLEQLHTKTKTLLQPQARLHNRASVDSGYDILTWQQMLFESYLKNVMLITLFK